MQWKEAMPGRGPKRPLEAGARLPLPCCGGGYTGGPLCKLHCVSTFAVSFPACILTKGKGHYYLVNK